MGGGVIMRGDVVRLHRHILLLHFANFKPLSALSGAHLARGTTGNAKTARGRFFHKMSPLTPPPLVEHLLMLLPEYQVVSQRLTLIPDGASLCGLPEYLSQVAQC